MYAFACMSQAAINYRVHARAFWIAASAEGVFFDTVFIETMYIYAVYYALYIRYTITARVPFSSRSIARDSFKFTRKDPLRTRDVRERRFHGRKIDIRSLR